ncbi:MAG: STAS domain-containing protein [Gemmatimonadales bacterium]
MLRLTRTSQPNSVVVKAEGQIVAEWVRLLEEECRELTGGDPKVMLDLADVSYLDRGAVRLLRELAGGRVLLINCSPLVAELLAEDGS